MVSRFPASQLFTVRARRCNIYNLETQSSGQARCLQGLQSSSSYIGSQTVSAVDICYRNFTIVSHSQRLVQASGAFMVCRAREAKRGIEQFDIFSQLHTLKL